MWKAIITETIIIFFEILFLYTGGSKIIEHDVFQEQLAESSIFAFSPELFAWLIPFAEITLAVLIFFPKWRPAGLKGSLILMIGFTLYVVFVLSSGEDLPCSCGGIISSLSWPSHLVFNTICVALLIFANWHNSKMGVQTATSIKP